MGLKAPKLSLILVAAAFALSCFGFTLFVWKSFGGPTPFQARGYQMHILFGSEASQLTPNADVRISGVNVGKVISVERRGLGADALVEMDSKFAPVHRDARAIIRFKTLLGESFIEMTPGSKQAPELEELGTLPEGNVAEIQQVDQVLGAFDKKTRAAFKKFLIDTSKALEGRGEDINTAIGHLAPTAESAADLMGVLEEQRSSLKQLVRDSGVTLRTMADRGTELRSLISAGDQVFAATAARNAAITRTVRAFPGFLRSTRAALVDIDGAAREAAPVLRALRPVIPLITPALKETNRLAPELKRTFDRLDRTFTIAERALPALTRILLVVRPALKVMYVGGRELIPVAQYAKLYSRDGIASAAKVAASTQFEMPTPDGNGQHLLRVVIPINEEAVFGTERRLPSNRTNAYPVPNILEGLGAEGGIKAFDCRNLSNPQTLPVIGEAPRGCTEQGAFEFRKVSRQFPHIEIAPK